MYQNSNPDQEQSAHSSWADMLPPTSLLSSTVPARRLRGENGRFIPAFGHGMAATTGPKRCGWCLTHDTTQWRVGTPSGGPMGILCNACGINYRRAVAGSGGVGIDLPRLAEAMGPVRPSIQKALKRVRREALRANTCADPDSPMSPVSVRRNPSLRGAVTKSRNRPGSIAHLLTSAGRPTAVRFRSPPTKLTPACVLSSSHQLSPPDVTVLPSIHTLLTSISSLPPLL